MLTSMVCPRIDQVNSQIREVADVSSGERCASGCHDARDLDVANFYRPTSELPACCHFAGRARGFSIEIQDAFLKVFLNTPCKRDFKLVFSAAGRQEVYSKSDLENCYGSNPNRLWWLAIHPGPEQNIGHGSHQA